MQAAAEGSSKDQLEISRRIRMCCLRQSIKAAFPIGAGGGLPLPRALGLVVGAAGGGRAAIRSDWQVSRQEREHLSARNRRGHAQVNPGVQTARLSHGRVQCLAATGCANDKDAGPTRTLP